MGINAMPKAYKWSAKKILGSLPKDPEKLLAYKFPDELQDRAEELLRLSHANLLDNETRNELKRFLQLDSRIFKLKAKVLGARNRFMQY